MHNCKRFSILLAALPALAAPQAPEAQGALPAPKAPGVESASSKQGEPLVPAGFVIFNSSSAPETRPFHGGYYGMPLVVGVYATLQKELHVVQGAVDQIFEMEGLGFKPGLRRELPAPPKDPAYGYVEAKAATTPASTGAWTMEKAFETDRNEHADVGYQIGEGGEVYWLASTALYRHGEEGWKAVWTFTKELATRRRHPNVSAGMVVLDGNRVALLGGAAAFIQVLELGDEPTAEPKVLGSVSYETAGCTANSYPPDAGPQFCVAGGNLYFYLNTTGRLFRLKLDSYALTDYDVPWPSEEFGATYKARKWRKADGGGGDTPVLPEALAFTPAPDGSVHVAALMYNMPMAVVKTFELSSEGSSIKVETLTGNEVKNPLTMRDAKGDLVPFPKAGAAAGDPRRAPTPASNH